MKKRRLIITLIICTMLLSVLFTACDKSSVNEPKETTSEETTTKETAEKEETETAEEKKELYEFTIFANFSPIEISDADEAFWLGLEEALNLKLNFEIPPSGNYQERKQIMLAGGEYPELVLFDSASDKSYIDSVRNGIVLPINDFLENAPNIVDYSYQVSLDSLKTMNDENIYGIPRTSVARADGFLVRKDWLTAVGIDIADGTTISRDKLTEVLTAFSRKDPDANELDDTYGMMVATDGNGNMDIQFGWSFGLIGWQKYGETYLDLKYSQDQDNYKEALAYTAMLWEEGLLDPDWPTLSWEVAQERMISGVYGMRGEFAGWLIQTQEQLQVFNPDAELIYVTGIEDNDGEVIGGSYSTGFWGQWSIMESAEKPERIIEMLDYSLSDAYWETVKFGPENVTWTNEGGVKTPTEAYPEYAWGRRYLRRNDDPDFFVTLNMSDENRVRLNDLIGKCIGQAVFSKDQGFRPATADDQTYIDANTELQKAISRIIVGDLSVDDWDAELQKWYDAGGQQYIQEINDHIIARDGE